MLKINDQIVFTTLEEIINPKHTALVIIDAQNDFCVEGGACARSGKDLSAMPTALACCGKLIERARSAVVQVIFVQNQKLPHSKSISGPWMRFLVAHSGVPAAHEVTITDTWGAEIVEQLKPRSEDIVIKKWRSSAFVGTNFDMILRANGIKSIVCCGFTTEGCVESTARDAGFYDYYAVVIEDAVANYDRQLHEASLMVQRTRYDVTMSRDVIYAWTGDVPPDAAAR
jgi:nicotinamidase-related amidase